MKSSQHGEYLTQLTRLNFVNCYLVREDDGLTLLDTGIPGSADAILAAAEQLNAPIVRIALTHGHQDHAGSLDALHGKLLQAEILLPERDARFMRGDNSLAPGEKQNKLGPVQRCSCAAGARTFTEGERIGSLEVIATPGHTLGHVSFRDTRDSTLIAGDVFGNIAGLQTSTKLLPFPLPSLASWDKSLVLESARKLASLGAARLALGHGSVVEPATEPMQAAVAKG